MKPVIFDSGPLVAWFCPRDRHHAWAKGVFARLPPGGWICEAVLTEVCHLVAKDGVPAFRVLEFVRNGRIAVEPLGSDLPRLTELLKTYSDLPMDFADACVLRLAEIHVPAPVCSLDRHFQAYRLNQRDVLPLVSPFAEWGA